MEELYLVAFKAGASGRFIANLIWGLLNASAYEYVLTDFNSTHNFTPYAGSYTLSPEMSTYRPYSNPNIFNNFKYIEDPGLITVHVYPKFDILYDRYPNLKTVIISHTSNDILEISGNCLLKNGFETIHYRRGINNDVNFIQSMYAKIFNEPYVGQDIPLQEKKQMFMLYRDKIENELMNSDFINPKVPEEFTKNTVILQYNDIVRNPEHVLNQLCAITQKPLKEPVQVLYQSYLEGRKNLIQTHMPWLVV